jgi:HSP20 family protein
MATQQSRQESTSRGSSERQQSSQQSGLATRRDTQGAPSLWAPLDVFNLNPFSMLRRFNEELNRAFLQPGSSPRGRGDDLSNVMWVPAIEVAQQNGNFVVSAELPGVQDADVRVEVSEDALVIRGERRVQREEEDEGLRRTEIQYGEFYRLIPLPDGADPEKAKAELQNGVLRIVVPVEQAQQSQPRQIPVETSSSQSASTQTGSTQSAGDGSTKQQRPREEKAA